MIERIERRYNALKRQIAEAQQQYAALEAELKARDRQLLAMFGGLHELEALMNDTPAEERNGAAAEEFDHGEYAGV